MLGLLNSLTFKRKISLLVTSAVVGLVVVSGISVVQTRDQIEQGRKAALHTAVQSAHSIVVGYKALADAGKMPEEAAKKAASAAVAQSRYGGADGRSDYFYIFKTDGFGVMHPKVKKWSENVQLMGTKNDQGVDTVKTMVDAINGSTTGAAYVHTMVARLADKAEKPVLYPKLQYMVKVAGWEWVVGSGLYMDDVNQMAFTATLRQLGLSLTVMLVIGGLGALVSRSVLRQLGGEPRQAIEVMQQVADGNLAVQVPQAGAGSLFDGLGRMVGSVRSTVTQVRSATENISTASSEIAAGNQNLSQRTEQTASNLQQAASSMEQLTGTVKQSADSARQANQLATSAAEVAQRGGNVVSQVVSTMEEINASSKKIADIIGVIDGIAFQTNILALNAAVEAARAGEQGRGFAVVAGEVRNLAQRSAEAAKEIKALIGTSVDKVETGTKLVADAGATMQEIVGSVQRVSDIIGEITAASSEQSEGIGQVNAAVTQLDQMTQQNAALVEESAAAAESLREQAGKLREVVSTFKTDGVSSGPAALAAKPFVPSTPIAPVRPATLAQAAVEKARKPAPPPAPKAPAVTAAAPKAAAAPAASAATDEWESF